MQKYLKYFRIIFAIVFLLGATFLFLDFSDLLTPSWYQGLLFFEFVPSLTHFVTSLINGLALTAWGWIAVMILTFLFGRIYCSFLCPLGIMQDVFAWLSRKSKLRKRTFRYKYKKPLNWVRYPILVLVVLSLLVTGVFFLNVLDPYSIFGRIVSDLFQPIYIFGNNILASLLEKVGSYFLYPIDIITVNPLSAIVSIAMLLLIVALSSTKGRFYCNSICPVGTFLGSVAKVSLFKPAINKTVCNKCAKCIQHCKAQCINVKAQRIDVTRCVGCFDCVNACDKGALKYRFTLPWKNNAPIESDPEDMENISKAASSGLGPIAESLLGSEENIEKIEAIETERLDKEEPGKYSVDASKRSFIAQGVVAALALSGLPVLADETEDHATESADGEKETDEEAEARKELRALRKVPICPPGSKSIEHFTKTCTACHLCVSACPTDVLRPSFLEYGLIGMNQPRMDFNKSFCNQNCTRCSEVCPAGAILPLTAEEKKTTQIGKVNFVAANCVVSKNETSCGSCAEHCPTKAVRMVPYKGFLTIPHTDISLCLGCGACQFACPITEKNAIFVLSNKEHQTITPPKEEVIEYEEQTEFPF